MSINPCPTCQRPTDRWLDGISKGTHVFYYRCSECATVWTLPKDATIDATPRVVIEATVRSHAGT